MKKLLLPALVMALIALTLPTAAFAITIEPFDFSNLVTEECEASADMSVGTITGTLNDGFWLAASDSSSLDGILSASTLNGLPVFLLNNPTATIYMRPAT